MTPPRPPADPGVRQARATAAGKAARQRPGSEPLPAAVADAIRKLRAAEPPPNESARPGSAEKRAVLDWYLVRLKAAGWPTGALLEPLGVATRHAVSERTRRADRFPCPPEVAALPCPERNRRP